MRFLIFLTEPPIGVAPNALLPSMRLVIAASISAEVMSRLSDLLEAEPGSGMEARKLSDGADSALEAVFSVLTVPSCAWAVMMNRANARGNILPIMFYLLSSISRAARYR